MTSLNVELIAVGNELLLGETVDTNSAFAARALASIGAQVRRTTIVGDDRDRLKEALGEARGRSPWIIVSGGLGPTHDDITRDVIAEVLGRPLEVDDELLGRLEARFEKFGYERMPAGNRCQAEVPQGAGIIQNENGTAPGLVIEDDASTFFVLPGVPEEMRAMLVDAVLPAIAAAGREPAVIRSRVVRTAGIGESALAERIDDIVRSADPLRVAFLPQTGAVDIRVTVDGVASAEADAELDRICARIRERVAKWGYGEGETTLPEAVLDALRRRGSTVAVAESCTAGKLGAALTMPPGASEVFVGGIIAYADRVKVRELAVPPEMLRDHGAVSPEVCERMARGVRERFGADFGCAITGVAGPGGGSPEKPVGLVYCGVDSAADYRERKLDYPGPRETVRERAVVATLSLLLRIVTAS